MSWESGAVAVAASVVGCTAAIVVRAVSVLAVSADPHEAAKIVLASSREVRIVGGIVNWLMNDCCADFEDTHRTLGR